MANRFNGQEGEDPFSVPVYESDGETVIGECVISGLPADPDALDEAPATTMAP